jgi:hypothetical protein
MEAQLSSVSEYWDNFILTQEACKRAPSTKDTTAMVRQQAFIENYSFIGHWSLVLDFEDLDRVLIITS